MPAAKSYQLQLSFTFGRPKQNPVCQNILLECSQLSIQNAKEQQYYMLVLEVLYKTCPWPLCMLKLILSGLLQISQPQKLLNQ